VPGILDGRLVRAIVLYHHTGVGRGLVTMLITRRSGSTYREVESADSGEDSYKAAHVGLILSV
jgi:hypothetical protein